MASFTKVENPKIWAKPLGSDADITELPNTVDPSQSGQASLDRLWPYLTEQAEADGGHAPRRVEMNALFKLLGDQIYFLQQGGFYQYDASVTYKKNAIVQHDGALYQSKQGDNKGHTPNLVDDEYWEHVCKLRSINGLTPDANGNIDLGLNGYAQLKQTNSFEADNTFKAAVNVEKLPEYTGSSKLDLDSLKDNNLVTKSLMQEAISRGNGGGQAQLIRVVQISKPVNNAKDNTVLMEFVGAQYESAYDNEFRAYREVQYTKASDTDWADAIIKKENKDSFTLTFEERLQPSTEYKLRARDVSTWGTLGNWSSVVKFTTAEDVSVSTPSVITITGGASAVIEVPHVFGSPFTTNDGEDEHLATQWQVFKTDDGSKVWDSNEDSVNLTEVVIPRGVLKVSTAYELKLRYKGKTYGWSDWGRITFKTAATFTYIQTPSITVEHEPNNVLEDPIINASEFKVVTDVGEQDVHQATSWRIENLDGEAVWFVENDQSNLVSVKVPHGHLKANTQYRVKCKYFGKVYESAWGVKEITTGAEFSRIAMPELTVSGAPDNVPDAPTLKGSEFLILPTDRDTDTHVSSTWEIWNEHETQKIWEVTDNGTNKTSIKVPSGTIEANNAYIFKLTYHGKKFASSKTARVIARTRNNFTYVEDPTLTVEGAPSDVRERPTLNASEFKIVTYESEEDSHASTDWLIENVNTGAKVFESLNDTDNLRSIKLPYGVLEEDTFYKFQVRYISAKGRKSNYVSVLAKTHTILAKIDAPSLSVQGAPINIPKTPELEAGAFNVTSDNQAQDVHSSTDWKIIKKSTGATVWQSLQDRVNKTSIVLSDDVLEELTEYDFMVRYHGTELGSSAWRTVTASTMAKFDFIYTPAITLKEGYINDNLHVMERPTFKATEFGYHSSAETSDMQAKAEWRIFSVDDHESPIWTKTITAAQVEDGDGSIKFNEVTLDKGVLHPSKEYFATLRYSGHAFGWSKLTKFGFSTNDTFATITPPAITVTGGPANVDESPFIRLEPFVVNPSSITDTHLMTDWEIRLKSGALVWASYNDKTNKTELTVPKGKLQANTDYKFKARYKGRRCNWSEWAEVDFKTKPRFLGEVDKIYPVGSIYTSLNETSPNELFGGEWERLQDGRFLIAANDTYQAGSTGGEATHVLSVNEMPSHTHSGSTSSAGSHDHSRGTIGNSMTGSAAAYAWNDRSITGQSSGVFSWGGETTLNAGGSWSGSRTRTLNFNGSSGFSGYTSSAGAHSHTMALDNSGGNAAHNNMPPYMAVYMWKRVA